MTETETDKRELMKAALGLLTGLLLGGVGGSWQAASWMRPQIEALGEQIIALRAEISSRLQESKERTGDLDVTVRRLEVTIADQSRAVRELERRLDQSRSKPQS